MKVIIVLSLCRDDWGLYGVVLLGLSVQITFIITYLYGCLLWTIYRCLMNCTICPLGAPSKVWDRYNFTIGKSASYLQVENKLLFIPQEFNVSYWYIQEQSNSLCETVNVEQLLIHKHMKLDVFMYRPNSLFFHPCCESLPSIKRLVFL